MELGPKTLVGNRQSETTKTQSILNEHRLGKHHNLRSIVVISLSFHLQAKVPPPRGADRAYLGRENGRSP